MALQTSGPISISNIKAELNSTSNSLRALSSAAGKSTPDSMSEFYGYSNNPAASHFTTATFTGNGSTVARTGLPFTPTMVWAAENASNSGTQHVYQNGLYEFRYSNTHRSMASSASSFGTNSFTLGAADSNINTSGRAQYLAMFNCPTVYNSPALSPQGIPAAKYRVNPAAGFGFVSWQGPITNSQLHLYGLNQGVQFAIAWSYQSTASVWLNSQEGNTTSRASSSAYVWQWDRAFNDSDGGDYYYTDNAMWLRFSDPDRAYIYRNYGLAEYFYDDSLFRRENPEYSTIFYGHSVTGISACSYHILTANVQKTVTLGWQPRFVYVWDWNTTGGYMYYHVAGMPSATSFRMFSATSSTINDDMKITLTSTGFNITAPSSTGRFYYAIR